VVQPLLGPDMHALQFAKTHVENCTIQAPEEGDELPGLD
jgi:hypothetical protein